MSEKKISFDSIIFFVIIVFGIWYVVSRYLNFPPGFLSEWRWLIIGSSVLLVGGLIAFFIFSKKDAAQSDLSKKFGVILSMLISLAVGMIGALAIGFKFPELLGHEISFSAKVFFSMMASVFTVMLSLRIFGFHLSGSQRVLVSRGVLYVVIFTAIYMGYLHFSSKSDKGLGLSMPESLKESFKAPEDVWLEITNPPGNKVTHVEWGKKMNICWESRNVVPNRRIEFHYLIVSPTSRKWSNYLILSPRVGCFEWDVPNIEESEIILHLGVPRDEGVGWYAESWKQIYKAK